MELQWSYRHIGKDRSSILSHGGHGGVYSRVCTATYIYIYAVWYARNEKLSCDRYVTLTACPTPAPWIATIILFWGREENLSLELWPLSLYVQMPRQNILVLGLFSNLLIVLPISSASSLTHERYILTDTEGLTTRPSMISSINSWVFHNYIIYASELFYIL